ncbi:MAG: hypothetical protein Q9220_005016 [cf. Caloplaca sp. 1 TL-2023]
MRTMKVPLTLLIKHCSRNPKESHMSYEDAVLNPMVRLPNGSEADRTSQTISSTNAGQAGPSSSRVSLPPQYHTPPSQLIAEPSSPNWQAPSSPVAGVVQRRQNAYQDRQPPIDVVMPNINFPPFREHLGPPMINLGHAPPVVQGIQLISPSELPDRFRSMFPFPLFNAVQSKCFRTAYKTSDNLILSSPTGSGKTVILELSICQLVSGLQNDQFKIVYMAPTKSLCAERQKDWQARFASVDLKCAELTGDTDQGQLRNVQNANIIITTPEKWDSMTRKWKDHAKLMQLVRLFLIDEVHILKETRGACLEASVSRMKSVGSNVRFIALSATVPNSEDIATWLGQNATAQHLPACRERFGEEFRPVKLQKHVYGLPFTGNDWGFDKVCDPKLPEIITRHSQKKPIMIFCVTRNATISTAKQLANWWSTKRATERQWAAPTFRLAVQDSDLKETLNAGVAFHHGGLEASDRHAIEKGFLEGQVNVICCTSTLAVGVNLPCHMVIIKNTMSFQDAGLKEYSDLEVVQMLGRAGRPQFENSAVAVIITKHEKLQKYEKMVSGQEILESSLHLNLIEHLNAEIGLGTIYDLYTAKRWLAGTFLYVRLGQNPAHYKLDGDATNLGLDDRIERICRRDIDLLVDAQLVIESGGRLKCTEFGDAMARYYVNFETMKGLLSLDPQAKMSDILSVLVGAEELHDVRFRATEKRLLKEINVANGIKYPIKVDIALPQHKRSLILQAELGGVEFPADEQYAKIKRQYQQDKTIIFNHINRLVRCVIDCQIHLEDAVAVRHALELARSFAARVWDNSPHQLKQITSIGPAAVRRLAMGGINSIESVEAAEPHKIEMLMSKNPPFGSRIIAGLGGFPKLRVSVKATGKGIDKPPKAPKQPAAKTSLAEKPTTESSSTPASTKATTRGRLPSGGEAMSKATKPIETVDLVRKRSTNEYAQVAPRAYRSLHELHEKVNKHGDSAVRSNTNPSFSYQKGKQPELSFLDAIASPDGEMKEASSDYGEGWMADLPSPSVLLQATSSTRDGPDALMPAPTTLLSVDDIFDDGDYELDIDGAAEHGAFEDLADIDAAVSDDTAYETAMKDLGDDVNPEVSHYFQPAKSDETVKRVDSAKLFMSTDSPKKPLTPCKRKLSESSLSPERVPEATKAKTEPMQPHANPDRSSIQQDERPSSSTTPVIKAGYPDWVYEFDPAFVAEWEPYAEFV